VAVFSKDLGIDLGTMFTRVADGSQVLMQEPTIVAIAVQEQKMVAVGHEARTTRSPRRCCRTCSSA
jgi:actin-like ATPase involved in cell morphogenesis